MTEPETRRERPPQAEASQPSGSGPMPPGCPPCPPAEERAAFPTQFARLFFGVITLLARVILIPLVSLVSIIANQALEFSGVVRQGIQSGLLWQWVDVKVNALHAWLLHLNLPVPAEQIQLDQVILTVLTKASEFIYANAIGLLKGFTYFFLDLVLVLFIAFFMFLQGDDFIKAIKGLSPLDAVHNEEIVRETE